jgi:hypothetical protein
MTAWVPQAGNTLHVPSGPDKGSGLHLHVVIHDPVVLPSYGAAVCIAMVGISSMPIQQGIFFDRTCLLASRCHPAIRHDSYVYYRGARIVQAREIAQLVAQAVYTPAAPMPAAELVRIRQGLLQSAFTSREIKRLFA